jgi:Domain of unknown function (DUF397)
MTRSQPTDAAFLLWRTSSDSGSGNQCVQIGAGVAVRDSKNPGGGHLTFGAPEWKAFLDRVNQGNYDR